MSRPMFIDVREPFEFTASHIPGAINIPLGSFANSLTKELKNVSRDTEIIIYCRSGARAAVAVQYLVQMGFTNVTNGINENAIRQQQI